MKEIVLNNKKNGMAMLLLFGLTNIGLFITTTLISFAVFAAFYWIVYRMTSGVYYRIVSGKESAMS